MSPAEAAVIEPAPTAPACVATVKKDAPATHFNKVPSKLKFMELVIEAVGSRPNSAQLTVLLGGVRAPLLAHVDVRSVLVEADASRGDRATVKVKACVTAGDKTSGHKPAYSLEIQLLGTDDEALGAPVRTRAFEIRTKPHPRGISNADVAACGIGAEHFVHHAGAELWVLKRCAAPWSAKKAAAQAARYGPRLAGPPAPPAGAKRPRGEGTDSRVSDAKRLREDVCV